jgi:cytosine/uracil/thiamine/allantoin permease
MFARVILAAAKCLPWHTRHLVVWCVCCSRRYAVSQRAQLLGQAAGLPPFMALFSFIGALGASAALHIAIVMQLCNNIQLEPNDH